jgi:hypothetical protein
MPNGKYPAILRRGEVKAWHAWGPERPPRAAGQAVVEDALEGRPCSSGEAVTTKYISGSHAGCAPMMERVRCGARLQRSKNSWVAARSASMLPNSSQWVTSRRKCRHSISIGFSHGL